MENLTLTESQLAKLTYPAPAVGSKKYGIVAKLNTETFAYEVYLDAFLSHVIDEAFESALMLSCDLCNDNDDPLFDESDVLLCDEDSDSLCDDYNYFPMKYKAEFEKGLLSVLSTEEHLRFLHDMDSENIFADIAVPIFEYSQSHFVNCVFTDCHQEEKPNPYDSGKDIADMVLEFIGFKELTSDYCLHREDYFDLVKLLNKESNGLSIKFFKSFDYKDKLTKNN